MASSRSARDPLPDPTPESEPPRAPEPQKRRRWALGLALLELTTLLGLVGALGWTSLNLSTDPFTFLAAAWVTFVWALYGLRARTYSPPETALRDELERRARRRLVSTAEGPRLPAEVPKALVDEVAPRAPSAPPTPAPVPQRPLHPDAIVLSSSASFRERCAAKPDDQVSLCLRGVNALYRADGQALSEDAFARELEVPRRRVQGGRRDDLRVPESGRLSTGRPRPRLDAGPAAPGGFGGLPEHHCPIAAGRSS